MIEICRRGMFKFEKGKFYPKLSRSDRRTMAELLFSNLGDLTDKTVFNLNNWKQAFNLFKQTGTRYRRELNENSKEISVKSHKSRVTEHKFCHC